VNTRANSRLLSAALVLLVCSALVAVGTSNARSRADATLPYSDSFNGADGSELSAFWTDQRGNITLSSNQAVGTGDKVNVSTLNGANAANVSVQADVLVGSRGSDGVVARYSGPGESNFYIGMLTVKGSKFQATIQKKLANGGYKKVGRRSTIGFGTGTLRLIAVGSSLKLLLNNELVAYAQDSSLGTGLAGVRADNGNALDNFNAAAQPATTPGVPFTDTFSSPGPGSQLSTDWTDDGGNVTIVGGDATGTDSDVNLSTVNGLSLANTNVSAPIALIAKQTIGLVARYSGPLDTFYLGRLIPSGHGYQATIWKCIAGKYRKLAAGLKIANATGTLTFQLSGSSLQLLLDATPLVAVTDTSIASPGSVGMWLGSGVAMTSFAAS
jgi:hypothetical protein